MQKKKEQKRQRDKAKVGLKRKPMIPRNYTWMKARGKKDAEKRK